MTGRRGRRRVVVPTALLAAVLLALPAACGTTSASGPDRTGGAAGDRLSGELTVLAAASLREAFTDIGDAFTSDHPGVRVRFSFAGSSALAAQVVAGAPADVLATASQQALAPVLEAGEAAGPPRVFAGNTLEIAVPPGNPGDVRGLADLADPSLAVALCAPEVPCGAAAEEVFAAAGVEPSVDTYEQDVKAALAKAELGEVDAALVYRTDVRADGVAVEGVPFAEAASVVNEYPVVALRAADDAALADAFVAAVLSPGGRRVLADAGFALP